MKKLSLTLVLSVIGLILFSQIAAAGTAKVANIRLGHHEGFTRLVFDSVGARPDMIGPATNAELLISYDQLMIKGGPNRLIDISGGDVRAVEQRDQNGQAVVAVAFKRPHTRVKYFYLPANPPRADAYRLVLDFYTPGGSKNGPGRIVAAAEAPTASPAAQVTQPAEAVQPSPTAISTAGETEPVQKTEVAQAAEESPPETAEEQTGSSVAPSYGQYLSGEISLYGRYLSGDDDSSKFTEYRDFDSFAGEFKARYDDRERFFFGAQGSDLVEDDINVGVEGGVYGAFKAEVEYDKLPHRYDFDSTTLYSGVGSSNLVLDDTLQGDLEGLAGDPIGQANRLNAEFATASRIGDPDIENKSISGAFEFFSLDPFTFRTEVKRVQQEGSRPVFGSFGLDNTIEIFEPVDSETIDIRLIAELARHPYFLNATYYYQQYKNDYDTVEFENPFRTSDVAGGPASGRIDLSPDNYFHNVSFSGAYFELPLGARISGTAAWGWMKQDEDLIPFTTNTALVFPINYSDPANLPEEEVDAEVRTSLYDVGLTARPLSFMHFKGRFRYYDYDNQTDVIQFPDGYVETDAFPALPALGSPIKNLPSSYTKIRTSSDLGFDVMQQTRLNLGFSYDRTERDNREVEEQDDYTFGGSVDTRYVPNTDLRFSYDRTIRDIDDYDFDVYLQSGVDLGQLPQLRKYDQADVTRDRVQMQASFMPTERLDLGAGFIYGRDDYDDSPYGLTEDNQYSLSLDAGVSITSRARVNTFYTFEYYDYEQKAFGNFQGAPTDWTADGTDKVHTVGGNFELVIIPQRLDLGLSYSFSHVDGEIDFDVAGADDYDTVNETDLHILNARLTYNFGHGISATLGYLYESFDYDDYNTEGFVFVPTTATGAYNGAILAGTLPEDYDVHMGYIKVTYRFGDE